MANRTRPILAYLAFVAMAGSALVQSRLAAGEAGRERKVKVQVNPVYPELARKMGVTGTVKLEITVSPAGSVKAERVIGGHPLLIDSATAAVKRWRYEAGPAETTHVVEFRFAPQE